ncbi:Alpha/Beta hydrolase protein [Xylariales sp. AK1849]|nr:Alpha/Beta hydrolase protein [Xylariales sp. AK1849]
MACRDCVSGSVHEGNPRGTITEIHGLETYISEPTAGRTVKGLVVIIPDAFGWDFINNRLLADHFADKADYRVYLPDFMIGKSAPEWVLDSFRGINQGSAFLKPYHFAMMLYGLIPWAIANRPGKTLPIVQTWFEKLRQHEGAHLPIGAAGYCWGGNHLVLMAAGAKIDGKPLFDAGFTGHPSRLKIPDDIVKIKYPVSFALAEEDMQISVAQINEIRKIVEAKPNGEKGEARAYAGCKHGWCVRADGLSKEMTKQAEDAEDQCLTWFKKHFQNVSC